MKILTSTELCCPLLHFWDGASNFWPLCLKGKLELDHGGGLEAGMSTPFSPLQYCLLCVLVGLLEMLVEHGDLHLTAVDG